MWEVIRSFTQLCRKKYEYACTDTKVRLCVTLMGKTFCDFVAHGIVGKLIVVRNVVISGEHIT